VASFLRTSRHVGSSFEERRVRWSTPGKVVRPENG